MTSTLNQGTQQKPPNSSRRKWVGLAVAGLIAALLAAGLIYFFGGAEPAEVDLDSTINAVSETTATNATSDSSAVTSATSNSDSGTSGVTDATGTWSVDTTTGTLNFEQATATFAGFRVEEELVQIGAATAVGRTPDVSGTVTIDGTTITTAEIEVDLTTIVSNESRRDDNIQGALNTNQNPTATFVITEPLDFGEVPTEGVTVSAVATGDLTINGVTNPVKIPLQARVVGDAILVVGSAEVLFSDYDVETPSAQVVLSVADLGVIELQLWLVRA